jgi:predicted signal transduction protein with EAL and GGDEF domain
MTVLPNSHYQSLWLGAVLMVVLALPLAALQGSVNDWLRLGLYAAATLLAWLISRWHARLGVLLHFVLALPVIAWLAIDPHSFASRLEIGAIVYGTSAMFAVLGAGVYLGWSGALVTLLLSVLMLIPQRYSLLWPFVIFQVTAAACIGTIIHQLILQLEATKQALERAALGDELTGLENRRALRIAFERYTAMADRRGVTLLLTVWDMNGLKAVNDSLGHAAGDALLQSFAQALKVEARGEDALFRVGGDEFVGLHLALENGADLTARVNGRFANVAVGWAVAWSGGLEATLAAADDMMYVNKARMKAKPQKSTTASQA